MSWESKINKQCIALFILGVQVDTGNHKVLVFIYYMPNWFGEYSGNSWNYVAVNFSSQIMCNWMKDIKIEIIYYKILAPLYNSRFKTTYNMSFEIAIKIILKVVVRGVSLSPKKFLVI